MLVVRRRTIGWVSVAAAIVSGPTPTPADDLLVPSQYATIGLAVRTARNGDTVIVADGPYTGPDNRAIDFGRSGNSCGKSHSLGISHPLCWLKKRSASSTLI